MVKYLRENEETHLVEIAEAFERHTSRMSDHLTKMVDYDVLRGESRGRKRFFQIKRLELVDAYLALRDLLGCEDDDPGSNTP